MSKKDATSTALTVQTSVPDAISVINEKIAKLKHIQDSVYKTPGRIQMAGGEKDIKVETSVTELVKAFSSVLFRAKAIDEAYTALGLDGKQRPVTKVDGGTVEEWTEDIKLRIAIIEQKETLDKLQSYKKQWEELMDKEDRKAMLLKDMEQFVTE